MNYIKNNTNEFTNQNSKWVLVAHPNHIEGKEINFGKGFNLYKKNDFDPQSNFLKQFPKIVVFFIEDENEFDECYNKNKEIFTYLNKMTYKDYLNMRNIILKENKNLK